MNNALIKPIFVLILLLNLCPAKGQYIPVSNSYLPLYEFLEELRADDLSFSNTFNGPLSEKDIAEYLVESRRKGHNMTYRQRNEIAHYLREFQLAIGENKVEEYDIEFYRSGNTSLSLHPFGFFSGDENNSFRIIPIGGAELTLNNHSGNLYYHKGLRTSGNVHGFAFYGKIDDQTYSEVYNQAIYLNPVYNYSRSAQLKDMLSGGISYSNTWLTLSLAHDKMHLGTSLENPLLISRKSPEFSQLKATLSPTDWLQYDFLMADLGKVSENTFTSGFNQREWLTPGNKRLALNQLLIKPIPSIAFRLGQLTAFSSQATNWYQYLPLNMYKQKELVDPIFFYNLGISTIPHVTIDFTHFFEKFSAEYLTYRAPKNHAGMQGRFVLSNWPVQNIILRTEYTYVSPFALITDEVGFQHAGYPLGWYLGDHSSQLRVSATVKPVHNLQLVLSYENSRKGDYNSINLAEPHYFESFKSMHWKESILGFCFRHQTSYYTQLFAGIYRISRDGDNTDYRTAPFLQNRNYSFNIGLSIGY